MLKKAKNIPIIALFVGFLSWIGYGSVANHDNLTKADSQIQQNELNNNHCF